MPSKATNFYAVMAWAAAEMSLGLNCRTVTDRAAVFRCSCLSRISLVTCITRGFGAACVSCCSRHCSRRMPHWEPVPGEDKVLASMHQHLVLLSKLARAVLDIGFVVWLVAFCKAHVSANCCLSKAFFRCLQTHEHGN